MTTDVTTPLELDLDLGPRRLRVVFLNGPRKGVVIEPNADPIRVGRTASSTVAIPDSSVSAQHAKIARLEGAFVLIDLESTNGTFLNGRRIDRVRLSDGDRIRFGGTVEVRVEFVEDESSTVILSRTTDMGSGRIQRRSGGRELTLPAEETILGRDETAGLRLDSPLVSRRHARLLAKGGTLVAEDLGSANGTFVDSEPARGQAVPVGGRVRVGPFVVEHIGPGLEGRPKVRLVDGRHRTTLEARAATVTAGERRLLDGVSVAFAPGSFTALIGPSGAGKSTLLGVLRGARRLASGQLLLGGSDVGGHPEAFESLVGHVPQEDIVHRELTVRESLVYTARLRLPPDTTEAERERRIDDVLAVLELTERADLPVHRLSGGQRKRVSIAAELLTQPDVLLLDEPASGLDPGLEESLMLLLRELSYQGTTVVIVTHTLDNVHLCDSVVLLAEGRLVFHGGPAQARAHFGLRHLVELYGKLKQKPSADWQALWATARPPTTPQPAEALAPLDVHRSGGLARSLRQAVVLTSRYLTVLTRDRRNLALLLLQAPLVAGLIGLSLQYGTSEIAYTKPRNTVLFLAALTAVWFGCSNAARELVKERTIYLRERRVGLRVAPYVASKVVVLAALALVQCIVLLGVLVPWYDVPGDRVRLLFALFAASGVGVLLGLLVSAHASTPDRAMSLLPILLIPQVLFTVPAVHMDMAGPSGVVARLMPTWWSYDLLRRVALAPDDALGDEALEKKLEAGGPALVSKKRVDRMLEDGYMLFQYRNAFETTWTASPPERLWPGAPLRADALTLLAFATAFAAGTLAAQKRLDRQE